jgi:hexosaminidase
MQAMAMNKYNVFHWHITDAQSFPLLLNRAPELALLGSHHPTQMYTKKDVAGLVSFAQAQGNGQGRRVAARIVSGCTVGQGLL